MGDDSASSDESYSSSERETTTKETVKEVTITTKEEVVKEETKEEVVKEEETVTKKVVRTEEEDVGTVDVSVKEPNVGEDALSVMDNKKFSWFHIKAILVAGVGFFTDAYDLFVINLVVPILGYVYWGGTVPVLESTLIKGAAVIGTFIGQISFGIIADRYGRKKIYGLELLLIIIGTVGSALSCNTVRGVGVAAMLSFWRLILGIGIGGDYPVSAIITSEYASKKGRGAMMAAVFSMQGFGQITGAIVAIILLAIFQPLIEQDPAYADYVWRLLLGLGILPALVAVYFRVTLPETPRYTLHVQQNTSQLKKDIEMITKEEISVEVAAKGPQTTRASFKDFCTYFKKWDNLRVLLGCALSWFLLDIAFYGLTLNQSLVLTAIGYTTTGQTPYQVLWLTATGNAAITMMGAVPGYWVTIATIEYMGRINIQLMGFVILTILFVILSAGFFVIRATAMWLFITLYALALFFQNWGPNTTTFIIPGEVFPTRYRSTGHGISAGAGKLGAIIVTYAFTPVVAQGNTGLQSILAGFSVVMFLGIFSTLLLPETRGKSLEELNQEGGEGNIAYYSVIWRKLKSLLGRS